MSSQSLLTDDEHWEKYQQQYSRRLEGYNQRVADAPDSAAAVSLVLAANRLGSVDRYLDIGSEDPDIRERAEKISGLRDIKRTIHSLDFLARQRSTGMYIVLPPGGDGIIAKWLKEVLPGLEEFAADYEPASRWVQSRREDSRG